MSHYKPYPNYNKSKVEWIGELPEDWSVYKLSHLTPVKRGASPRPIDDPRYFDDEGKYSWVRIQDVTASKGKLTSTSQQLSKLGASKSVKMRPGSLFLSIAATVGVPCITEIKCCIHDGFVYFPMLPIEPAWLYRVFESRQCFVGLGKTGTQLNLNTETVGGISIPLPPPSERKTIISALDREIARVDALIKKKAHFIELLKEKRQALLHECLRHPDTIRIRVERCTDTPFRPVDRKAEIEYIRLGLYNRGRGTFHKPTAIGEELGDSTFTWVQEGDLILSGQFAWEGAASLASKDDHDCIVSHRYHTYRGKPGIVDTAYLWAYFTSHEGNFVLNDHSRGSAGRNRPLNPNSLAKEKVPVPPMPMQEQVAALVRFENRFKELVGHSISLLNEHRSALITAAVTGQIDLREDAA
ncbi:MAG: restriction endonuclease subunit S [Candidatus Thiodiazotropha endolucinida]|nr:restriction endonuclease subunit S [Candidatus Thiodiazotropha taylori]MCW4268105.1 restriction endonuclease subunit S [Candidatus Thiodiazotropha endolucinida]